MHLSIQFAGQYPTNKEKRDNKLSLFSRFTRGSSNIALDLGSLASTATQVEQLCAADLALADNRDLLNEGAVDGEDTLDTNAVGNAANGEGLSNTTVLLCDDSALESLDTLTIAVLDTNINADGIANVELRLFSLDAAFRNNLQCERTLTP